MKTSLGWMLSRPMRHAPESGSEVNLVTCHTLRLNTFSGDDLNVIQKDGECKVKIVYIFLSIFDFVCVQFHYN